MEDDLGADGDLPVQVSGIVSENVCHGIAENIRLLLSFEKENVFELFPYIRCTSGGCVASNSENSTFHSFKAAEYVSCCSRIIKTISLHHVKNKKDLVLLLESK